MLKLSGIFPEKSSIIMMFLSVCKIILSSKKMLKVIWIELASARVESHIR